MIYRVCKFRSSKYSPILLKYDTYYYQRQYGDITNKVITKAIESQEQKQEHDKVEVLDI